jgi:plasmid stabilization system protein ParE
MANDLTNDVPVTPIDDLTQRVACRLRQSGLYRDSDLAEELENAALSRLTTQPAPGDLVEALKRCATGLEQAADHLEDFATRCHVPYSLRDDALADAEYARKMLDNIEQPSAFDRRKEGLEAAEHIAEGIAASFARLATEHEWGSNENLQFRDRGAGADFVLTAIRAQFPINLGAIR